MAYDPQTPWSWAPDDWQQGQGQPVGMPLQPGQVMPEAGAFAPVPMSPPAPRPEIEMPAMDMARPPEPFIGFPTNPDEAPLPTALDHAQASPAELPAMPPDPGQRQGMQPGLGIPASMIDQAAIGSAPDGIAPLPPEPDGEIEMEPDQLTEADRKQGLEDMDGSEFASFAAEQDEARRQDAAGKLARAATEDARRAEDAYKIFTQARESARNARAEVEEEAAKLAETEDVSYSDSLGPGQKIANLLMAVVGGLVQGRTGGRNDGLALIERENERYVSAQQAKRAQQRALIGDRRTAANDQIQDVEADARSDAAYRAAGWERTIRSIEAEQGNYDPAGTSAIRLESVRREAIGKQQTALMAFEEQQIKRMEAQGKTQLEISKFVQKTQDDARDRAEAERHNRQAERAALTSAGATYLTAKTNAKKADAEIDAIKAENAVVATAELQRLYPNAPKEAFNVGPSSLKKFEKHLATFGKSADVGKDQSEATIKAAQARLESSGPGGSPYTVADQSGSPFLAKDGKAPLEVKDTAKLAKITEVRDAAINIRKAADLYKVMRTKYGGASEAFGSDEYQEYKSLVAGIDFETYKLFGLGAPSAGDQQMAADIRGGKDPTSFLHDSSGGFEAYAKNAESKLNTMVTGSGGAPVKLKSSEVAKSYERNIAQNIDTWEPEALKNPDASPEAKKEAAQAALASVDALAGQADEGLLKILAQQNAQRVADGLVDPVDGARVQKTLRRAYAKKLVGFGDTTANKVRGLSTAAGLGDDEYLDRELGIGGAK